MTEVKPEDRAVVDGRVLRGTRNRDRITDALFELIESGELIPTAEQDRLRNDQQLSREAAGKSASLPS
jgi:methyltransferase-like protein